MEVNRAGKILRAGRSLAKKICFAYQNQPGRGRPVGKGLRHLC
jgi:hypothetical protein